MLQQIIFENKMQLWEDGNFYNNLWPLLASPKHYVEQVTKNYLDTRQPIQIIVTDSLPPEYKTVMRDIQSFFTTHYPQREPSPVIYYSQGWKDSMRHKDGTAQLMALHEVLAGLPTMVLMPGIDTATKEFHLKMGFWGMGDFSNPHYADLLTLDMTALEQELIRQDTHGQMEMFLKCPALTKGNHNHTIYQNEQHVRNEMQKAGCSEEEIANTLNEGVAGRYKKEQAWVLKKASETLTALIAESGATLVDFYQLLDETPALPRLPEIIRAERPQDTAAHLGRYAATILGLLDADVFTSDLHRFTLPMSQAVAAKAFHDAGDAKTAAELQARAWRALQAWYKGNDQAIPDGHRACIQYLQETGTGVPVSLTKWCDAERLTVSPPEKQIALRPAKPKALPARPPKKRAGDTETVDLGDGVELELVWCPPGTFWMGSPTSEWGRDDNETRHKVTLTRGFWIGKYPVTMPQWVTLVACNLSWSYMDKDSPMTNVDWDDCKKFFRKLNSKFPGRGQFRLPTEAEWEYACRAGTETEYAGTGVLREMGWYVRNSRGYIHSIGMKSPNDWGLHDMHGNVWEWCQDWYKEDYPPRDVVDPRGAASGTNRVLRGGCRCGSAENCRSAYRNYGAPSNRLDDLGFRVVRVLP